MKTIIAAFCDGLTADQAVQFIRNQGAQDVQLVSQSEGNLKRRLDDLDIPDDRAQAYAEVSRRGAPLLVAHVEDDDANRIANQLDSMGSLDLDAATTRWRSQGWTGYDDNSLPYDADACAGEQAQLRQESMIQSESSQDLRGDVEQGRDIDVVEEQVAIGKRAVDRGGVRVRTFVVERPVREQVELREERIDVAREPVNERIPANAADTTFTEEEFEVTAQGEEAVVGKEARVVERVHVGKSTETRTENIEETERRKDVEVESLQGTTTPTTEDPLRRR